MAGGDSAARARSPAIKAPPSATAPASVIIDLATMAFLRLPRCTERSEATLLIIRYRFVYVPNKFCRGRLSDTLRQSGGAPRALVARPGAGAGIRSCAARPGWPA